MPKAMPFLLDMIEVTPGMDRILLFREGKNDYVTIPSAYLTEANANKIIAEFQSWGRDMQVDYNHDSVKQKFPGPYPASGWINSLEFVKGMGLYAHVKEWTKKALELITNKEYRYFSPVAFITKASNMIVGIHNVALTNDPNTKHLQPLIADRNGYFNNNLEDSMKELLCKLLGIAIDTDDDKVEAEANKMIGDKVTLASLSATITEQKAKIDGHNDRSDEIIEIALAAGLDKGADKAAIIAKVTGIEGDKSTTLKALESVQAKLTKLETDTQERGVQELIQLSLNAGKITAADAELWARDMAKNQPDVFKKMMDTRAAVVPIDGPKADDKMDAASLTEADRKVAKMMGITPEQLIEGSKPLHVAV